MLIIFSSATTIITYHANNSDIKTRNPPSRPRNHLLTLLILITNNNFYLSLDISVGLRDVHVTIPGAIKRGDNALLICNYDMEGDSLYSVKWYKGKREFYRYTPKDEQQSIKTFPVAGINVEVRMVITCV